MLKKFTLFVFCAAIVAVTSCKDDDGPGVEPPLTVNKLTKAYGVVNPSGLTTDSKTVQLIISNVQSDFTEDFAGEGQYISLLLTSSEVSVVDGNIHLSPGTYSLPAVGGSPLVIEKDADSYFGAVDKTGEKTSQVISAGSIKISETSDGYTIAGTLAGVDNAAFGFEFSGVIYESAGAGEKNMTAVEVRYNNKFIADEKFVYTIALTNDAGQQVSLEICTPMSNFFKEIPAQTYAFSATETTAGTILNSDDSFYQISADGKKYPIEQGEITLAQAGSDYTVTGTVSTESNPGLEFSFTGALPITKASLHFKDGELLVDGQNYGFNYCDYTFYTTPSGLEGVGERMLAYMTGPVDHYYRYLPMAKGIYNVFGGDFPLSSFIISSNLDFGDHLGFTFYDSEANETLYALTGGSLEMTSSSMVGTKYSFALSGELTSATEDGEELTVDLTWDGTLDLLVDYAGYWYGYLAHPWTTLKADLARNDFASAVYESHAPGYWYTETGITDRGYVEICCMTEGGEYGEWEWDPDEANPNNYYLLIGLNVATPPADGIPVGTFTMDKNWTFSPGTFMPGSSLSWNNNYVGCHIVNGTSSVMAPFGCGPNDNGGSIVISKSGNNYTITVNCFDDGGSNKAFRVVASYTGPITSANLAPALPAPKKSMQVDKRALRSQRTTVRR